MAFGYRVYEREFKKFGSAPEKGAIATAKSVGVVSVKELAADISDRCSLHRSDVIAVLDALSVVAMSYLTKGFSVRLGELGSFSTSIKCALAPSKEEFKPELIRGANIRFTPSVEMKSKIKNTGFLNLDTLLEKKESKAPAESGSKGGTGSEDEDENSLTV